jgi:Flp pilus assembly protein TadG
MMRIRGLAAGGGAGQALVEFALAITVFLALLMGVVDFGRAIYAYNGVSQAAQSIARVASVHPGTDPTTTSGWSAEMQAMVSTQQGLVPGLLSPTITCVDIEGSPVTDTCRRGDYIRVLTATPFNTPADPLGALAGLVAGPTVCAPSAPYPAFCLQSTSTVALQMQVDLH